MNALIQQWDISSRGLLIDRYMDKVDRGCDCVISPTTRPWLYWLVSNVHSMKPLTLFGPLSSSPSDHAAEVPLRHQVLPLCRHCAAGSFVRGVCLRSLVAHHADSSFIIKSSSLISSLNSWRSRAQGVSLLANISGQFDINIGVFVGLVILGNTRDMHVVGVCAAGLFLSVILDVTVIAIYGPDIIGNAAYFINPYQASFAIDTPRCEFCAVVSSLLLS